MQKLMLIWRSSSPTEELNGDHTPKNASSAEFHDEATDPLVRDRGYTERIRCQSVCGVYGIRCEYKN